MDHILPYYPVTHKRVTVPLVAREQRLYGQLLVSTR